MNKNYENQTNPLRRIVPGKSGIFVLIGVLLMLLSFNTTVMAQSPPPAYSLVYPPGTSEQCIQDPTVFTNIGLSNSTANWVHVLFRVTLNSTYVEEYTRVAYSLNAYGGPIQFGDVDLSGKYVAFVYKDGEFNTSLINTPSPLADYWIGGKTVTPVPQNGAFWIIAPPAERTLSFTGTDQSDYNLLTATKAEFCEFGSVTLTDPEYSPPAYGSEWDVTYTLLRDGIAILKEIDGTTDIFPVVNPNTSTIVWNNLPTGTYTVFAERTPCAGVEFPSTGLDIIVVNAVGVTISAIDDIATVNKTPVVITATVIYPDMTYQQIDNSVLVDALVQFSPQLPAGANVVELLYNGSPVTMANSGAIAQTDEVLLSSIIGGSPLAYPLNGHSGLTDVWTIVVAGIDVTGTYSVTLNSVAYVGNYNDSYCKTTLDTEDFDITFADAVVEDIVDFSQCYAGQVAFDYKITYPATENVNNDVKNDAKIEVFSSNGGPVRNLKNGSTIAVYFNTVLVNTYTLTGDYNKFYLSALLSNAGNPTTATTQGILNDEDLIQDVWTFNIDGIDPGNYFVKVTNFAQYDAVEYPYYEESFLLNYVGALGVTIDNVTNISTATNAPVIFEAKVNYPQSPDATIAEQFVDPSVMVDALLNFTPALPVGTTIAEIQYNGSVIPVTNPNIGGPNTQFRLSEILGTSPTALLGHSPIVTDTWKISVENLNVAGTYSVQMTSIAFVNFATCTSILASETFTVTTADLTIDPISNISSITKTPVIIPVKVVYPTITPYDNTIKVDAKVSVVSPTAAFPANTKILGVSLDGGVTNLLTLPSDISGLSSFLLSDVLTISPVDLVGETGKTLNWEILVMSETAGVINVKVESIVTYPLNANPFVLASRDFSLTYADVTFDAINDITVCSPADVVIEWCETYPLVDNVGGNRVLNDSKFTFFTDATMTTPLSLPVGTKIKVTTPALNTFTSTLGTAVNTVYGSAVVAVQSPNPSTNTFGYIKSLERPASGAPACWKVEIIDAPAGSMYVKVEHMALLDWPGTSYFYPLVPPFGPHGTFEEYVFLEDEFKVIKVGAADVEMDILPGEPLNEISTVTGAPIVVPINVTYPDLVAQNIDPSVMTDALISGLTDNVAGFPTGAKIIDVKYNGTSYLASPYTITTSPFLLSTVLGAPAPTALLGHSNLNINWEITLADVDVACTVTTTVKAIAYVDYGVCHAVLDSDVLTAVYADVVVTGSAPDTKCAPGTVITNFTLQYPAISANNPSTIDSDAKLEFDNAIPSGTVMTWAINPGSVTPRSYTFTTGLAANTPIKLSTIINGSTGSGLSGTPLDFTIANNLYQAWTLTFTPLNEGFYNLKYTPIATLGTRDDVLITNPTSGITQLITIYEVPTSQISGDAVVFSGSVHQYSVPEPTDPLNQPVPGATYTWTASPSGIVTFAPNNTVRQPNVTFTWADPLPSDTVTLTVTVSNGYCNSDPAIPFGITINPNQLVGQVKYYNAMESPMPSPFNTNYYGMTVPDYFYVSLVPAVLKASLDPVIDAVEIKLVQEYYGEEQQAKTPSFDPEDTWHFLLTDEVYEAAYGFDYNLNPNIDYVVVVWDGSYYRYWDENPSWDNGKLGQTWTWNNWGGGNALDALLAMHMSVGNDINGYGLNWIPANGGTLYNYGDFANDVADVNNNSAITALDALLISRRATGLIQKFTNNKPNFAVNGLLVDKTKFNTSGSFGVNIPDIDFDKYYGVGNYIFTSLALDHYYYSEKTKFGLGNKYFNIYYNAIGDINASYQPQYGGFKTAPAMELNYEGQLAVNKGDEITIPVSLDQSENLGAISLGLTYRNDLIEVIGTNYGEDFAYFDHQSGMVRIAWASMDGANFNAGDAVAYIKVRVLGNIEAGTRLFELDNFTELADVNASVIEGVNFKAIALSTDGAGTTSGGLSAANSPNPFNDKTTISYTLPEAGTVNLVVYNKMGQIVKTLVSEYQTAGVHQVTVQSTDLSGAGVYLYKLDVKGETNNYSSTNSMILIR